VQQKTFTYFWDFGHPVSGLSGRAPLPDVSPRGSGFGVMAILTGIQRNFISRTMGLPGSQMVNFWPIREARIMALFAHWMNGAPDYHTLRLKG